MNKFLASLSVLIPFLLSAYVMYSISFVIVPLSEYLSVSTTAIVGAITLSWIGGAIGGLIFGRLSDLIGRRKALLISFFLFSIPEILMLEVHNLIELYALWFIIGLGVNGENGISYAVIAELRLVSFRGLLGGIMQGFYALGALLGAITALILGKDFMGLFLIAGLLSLISFAFYPFIPEARFIGKSKFSDIFKGNVLVLTVIGSIASLSSFLFIIPAFELLPTIVKNDEVIAIGDIISTFSFALAGYISDIKSRKFSAITFGVIAIFSSIVFSLISNPLVSLLIFFSSAFFAFFGVWLSELYPARIRGTGSNFALLIGRLIGGGFGTLIVALIASEGIGLREALGITLVITSIVSVLAMSLLKPVTE